MPDFMADARFLFALIYLVYTFSVQYLTVVLERKDELTRTYVLAAAAPCCAEEIMFWMLIMV